MVFVRKKRENFQTEHRAGLAGRRRSTVSSSQQCSDRRRGSQVRKAIDNSVHRPVNLELGQHRRLSSLGKLNRSVEEMDLMTKEYKRIFEDTRPIDTNTMEKIDKFLPPSKINNNIPSYSRQASGASINSGGISSNNTGAASGFREGEWIRPLFQY